MRRRISVDLIETVVFDVETTAPIFGEEVPEDDRLKQRIEDWIGEGDGAIETMRRGMSGIVPLIERHDHDYRVEVQRYCTIHPDEVIETYWRNEAGEACCHKCWAITPMGVAAHERLNEAKALAASKAACSCGSEPFSEPFSDPDCPVHQRIEVTDPHGMHPSRNPDTRE